MLLLNSQAFGLNFFFFLHLTDKDGARQAAVPLKCQRLNVADLLASWMGYLTYGLMLKYTLMSPTD